MKVLLTGASGFVGRAVARALVEHGHGVMGLVRNTSTASDLEAIGVGLAIGDMRKPCTYGPLVRQVDAVIHAAQEKPAGRWTHARIRAMHESDALMTRVLAAACVASGKRLIYSSGMLAHAGAGDTWIDEDTALDPCLLARGHAGMAAELLQEWHGRGLDVQVMSPGFIYGAGGFLKETVHLLQRRRYRVIGAGTNYWSMVHVEDVARAYVLALERGHSGGHYFLGDDAPMRRHEVIHAITDAMGISRVAHVPGWIAGLMLGFPLVEAITRSIRGRNLRIKNALGWQPTYPSFGAGLLPVLDTFRTHLG